MAQSSFAFLGSTSSFLDWQTLHERGLPIEFVNIKDLVLSMSAKFDSGMVELTVSGRKIAHGQRYWYNPGTFENLEDDFVEQDTELRYLARQHSAALLFLEHAIGPSCLDLPDIQRRWSNKPLQLAQLAKHLSGSYPQTVLSSDPTSVLPNTVIKHVGENRWVSSTLAFYAQRATADVIASLRSGPATPFLSQRLLEFDSEYRAFNFGEEVAIVKFPRQRGDGIVDLQYYPDSVRKAEPSQEVVDQAFWETLRRTFDLKVFAVDFVLEDGCPVILEVNPTFGWAWLPVDCIDSICDAVERFLQRLRR